MANLRVAVVLAGAALAIGGGSAHAIDVPIQLPPLADAILNGNTSNLDPVLVEALRGDFSFALGISIGSAFAAENVALAEAFTSAVVLRQGSGSGEASALVEVFTAPEMARVLTWVEAQASAPARPVSPE